MIKTGFRLITALIVASLGMGCTTAYDYYGRPRQVVEPGAAIFGAAAIGLLAFGLANSNNDDGPHYQPRGYHRGYDHHGYQADPCLY